MISADVSRCARSRTETPGCVSRCLDHLWVLRQAQIVVTCEGDLIDGISSGGGLRAAVGYDQRAPQKFGVQPRKFVAGQRLQGVVGQNRFPLRLLASV